MTALLADIGATNARFALTENGEIHNIQVFKTKDYPSLKSAIDTYLEGKEKINAMALGLPCTITPTREKFSFVNNPKWNFSRSVFINSFDFDKITFVNDFLAIAYGVSQLEEKDLIQVGGEKPQPNSAISVIGPGTGLGTSVVVQHDGRYIPFPGQGGHTSYPAMNDREYTIVRHLYKNGFPHVSAEDLISGQGMVNVYKAIAEIDGVDVPERRPSEISHAGLEKTCAVCEETIALFCAMLGTIAGNFALSPLSFGGVYIAGGIVMKLGKYFEQSEFRSRFENKSPNMKKHVQRIPAYVITHPYPAFEGLKTLI